MEPQDDFEEIRDANAGAAQAFAILKRHRPSMFGFSPVKPESPYSSTFVDVNVPGVEKERFEMTATRYSQDGVGILDHITESPVSEPPRFKSIDRFDRQASIDSVKNSLPGITPSKSTQLHQEKYVPSQQLDLSLVIQHFEEASKRAQRLEKSETFTPRFTFYSEKTGVVRSSFFNTIDISMDGTTIKDSIYSGPFWLDVCQATPSELNEIARVFGLHPLTNEDIQTPDTREKCEVFSKYFYVVIRSFEQDQFKSSFLQPITVDIVIFEECILSFSQARVPHTKNVRARIDQLAAYGQHVTTEWINYALIDDITDSFMPVMKVIEMEVDTIEDLVLILAKESEQADMLRRIGMVRKRVMQLLRLMSTKADVIKTIINR